MTNKIRTRSVDRILYTNYLKRANECFTAAKQSFARSQWNASTITAIHSTIAALDALCVYFLGKRHAGQSHEGAIGLFRSVRRIPQDDMDAIANRVLRILTMKNVAEYEERLVYQREAERVLRDAEIVLGLAKAKLPK